MAGKKKKSFNNCIKCGEKRVQWSGMLCYGCSVLEFTVDWGGEEPKRKPLTYCNPENMQIVPWEKNSSNGKLLMPNELKISPWENKVGKSRRAALLAKIPNQMEMARKSASAHYGRRRAKKEELRRESGEIIQAHATDELIEEALN